MEKHRKDGKGRWICPDGRYIVKDTIIGYLAFKSKSYFCSGGLDYKSYETLSEAKNDSI